MCMAPLRPTRRAHSHAHLPLTTLYVGLYVYNKVDVCSMEEVDEIARRPFSIPISCYHRLNMDGLLSQIWEMMASGC